MSKDNMAAWGNTEQLCQRAGKQETGEQVGLAVRCLGQGGKSEDVRRADGELAGGRRAKQPDRSGDSRGGRS